MHRPGLRFSFSLTLLAAASLSGSAAAQSTGFQLDRYEPTPAGEWFFSVEHPWFSSTRYFAGGITLDYGHKPLVLGRRADNGDFSEVQTVVGHQLVGHLDLAGSFLDRILLSASLPITFLERGGSSVGVGALSGAAVGDPRLGFMIRLWGHADREPFGLAFGGYVWIPIGANGKHAGDPDVRILPRVAIGGTRDWLRWSVTASFLARNSASLTLPPSAGSTVGHEVQIAAAAAWIDGSRRFNIGPELNVGTVASHFFNRDYTSLELLGGAHYLVDDMILVGVAAGLGLLREPGTPDFRLLARMAYAPVKRARAAPVDSDGDGIPDKDDACPFQKGPASLDPAKNGCPLPPADRDHDGIEDARDLCPDEPKGDHPDPKRLGCPAPDSDGDGIYDYEDQCPVVPAGDHPDPDRKGCPDKDTDGDGVYDHQDQCPTVPAGVHPDPKRPGCPAPDRDGDGVPDEVDACPDTPGAPSTDPKKNGCPGLVVIKNNMLVILSPVFFATNKDVILVQSFAVLEAVAQALMAQPEIKRVAIEGHTDNRGKPEKNLDLSNRRAKSVMSWLGNYGIAAERLESRGFGDTKPIANNKTPMGRATNRRVEFRIVDPAPSTPVTPIEPPSSPEPTD